MKELTPEHPASGNSPVDAMLTLEKATEPKTLVFTAEQMALAERLYPCFGERFSESAVPGDLCSSDANVASPPPKGIGKVALHAVVTTRGSHAVGTPCT